MFLSNVYLLVFDMCTLCRMSSETNGAAVKVCLLLFAIHLNMSSLLLPSSCRSTSTRTRGGLATSVVHWSSSLLLLRVRPDDELRPSRLSVMQPRLRGRIACSFFPTLRSQKTCVRFAFLNSYTYPFFCTDRRRD